MVGFQLTRLLADMPGPPTKPRRFGRALLPLIVLGGLLSGPSAAASPTFRVGVETPGVYRLTFEDLAAAGLETPLESAGLELGNQGRAVPIWVEDGDDGLFGPGDRLEWVGEHLRGEKTFHHPFSRHNVYVLRSDAAGGFRMRLRAAAEGAPAGAADVLPLAGFLHLERDELMIRLPQADLDRTGDPELWYWAKLTHIDPKPLEIELDLPDLDPAGGAVRLTAYFRALSEVTGRRKAPNTPDHRIELRLAGALLGAAEWDGRNVHRLELELDARQLQVGSNRLELQIPPRIPEGKTNEIVDVAMLDWIEILYPRAGSIAEGRLQLAEPGRSGQVVLEASSSRSAEGLVAYSDVGQRILPDSDAAGGLRFAPREDETRYLLASPNRLAAPAWVEIDRPSDWRSTDHQADYLMVAHPSLLEAIEPLAEAHRRRGLTVAVVDVQDVYDEFNHGIPHARAVRELVSHTYHRWRAPAPRFLLLVGDASWDIRSDRFDDANYANWTERQLLEGERFVARETHHYSSKGESRNLIPTWNFHSAHGHSATDNYFVTVAGDDYHPELAIGRLPVATPEEVRDIVEKTVAYLERPPPGPWRNRVLWIANDDPTFQQRSDRLAQRIGEHGFEGSKVYPEKSEKDNQHHQEILLDAFDQGQLLVHFYGHGGRNIWRTGPPSLRKKHDLFTLEHIDQLQPTGRLPFVLSMTCFSAPFDHPTADSIGEKMLRAPHRGAIAVLAASWRTPASLSLSQVLLEELLEPEIAIGTALRKAKGRIWSQRMVEMYNLLGDPAIPLPLPTARARIADPTESATTKEDSGLD